MKIHQYIPLFVSLKGGWCVIAFFAGLWVCCKEPYTQNAPEASVDYLVVEGIINTSGPTTISLTRTLKISDKLAAKGELKAALQVEGETSGIFPMIEKGSGFYTLAQISFNTSQKYRLRIRTSKGITYLSDFVDAKVTPAIDSISWIKDTTGVHIYANAHDTKKLTRYYQWDYEEIWEQRSIGLSEIKTLGPPPYLVFRDAQETIKMYDCWKYVNSSNILIGSTAKLNEDIIYRQPIQFIPNKTDRLGVKYTILVRQRALSKEAFEYFSLMKKNSDQTGSLFDTQPTEIKGNIHNISNASEMVIGFVQMASVNEQRIWITPGQVPGWDTGLICETTVVVNDIDSLDGPFGHGEVNFGYGKFAPINIAEGDPTKLRTGVKINAATAHCLDCRLRGGINTKPSFW